MMIQTDSNDSPLSEHKTRRLPALHPSSFILHPSCCLWVIICLILVAPPAAAQPLLLQDIFYDQVQGTVAFQIPGPLRPSIKYFDRPDRIVMDLPEVLLNGPQRTISIGRDGIVQVRIAQFQKEPAVVRVVFDVTPGTRLPGTIRSGDQLPVRFSTSGQDRHLLALSGFPLQPGPDAPSAVRRPPTAPAGIPGQLSSLEFRSGEVVVIGTQQLAVPTVAHSSDGRLCTVTFAGLIAPQGLNELPVRSAEVKSVRIVALPAVTQFVLELNTPQTYTFRQEAGGRSVRLLPAPRAGRPLPQLPPPLPSDLAQVRSLSAHSENGRTDVVIHTDKPMQYRISRAGLPERVVVDIPQSVLAAGLEPVITNRDPLTQVRLSQPSPDTVRIVLDLTTFSQFESALSPDGKELHIGLLNLAHAPPRGSQLITLDPGHGGTDPGAIGTRGTTEAEVVLSVAEDLRKELVGLGHTVLLTRSTDVEVLLQPRVDVANQNRSNILISVHCNSSDNRQAYGIETYYKWPHSFQLARSVHRQLVSQLGSPDRGVRRANFFMVNHTAMPAVLVEIGYISNPTEEGKLGDPTYRRAVARAIADGIKDFLAQPRSQD